MEETRFQKDRKILCRILPEIVWCLIHSQLARFPLTMEVMFHASPFLRQLLYSLRSRFLFSRVLPLISPLIKEATSIDSNKLLSRDKTLLKLRQVCSSWSRSIDDQLVSCFQRNTLFPATGIFICPLRGNQEAEFLPHFQETHSAASRNNRSPFVGNAVTLYLHTGNIPMDTKLDTLPFQHVLQKYGTAIQYCNIRFFPKTVSELWYETSILRALSQMPNIKVLTLDLEPLRVVTNNAPANFRVDLAQLNSLKELEIGVPAKSEALARKLLFKMPKLRKITLVQMDEISPDQNLLLGANLILLETLEMRVQTLRGYPTPCPEYHQNYLVLRQHECVMNGGLHATLRTLEEHSTVPCLHTLKVWLTCPLASSWTLWSKYSLSLPNLTKFTLFSWTWSSIDMILLFCNSLKHMQIKVQTPESLEEWNKLEGSAELRENEKIKFLSYNGILGKEHNIWEEMPKLETVSIWRRVSPEQAGPELVVTYHRNGGDSSLVSQ